MIDLTGQVAIVTGSAQGIGRAIATQLVELGATVSLWDRNAEALQVTAKELSERGPGTAVAAEVDVTDRAVVEAAHAKVLADLGPVDILVNNAAVEVIKPFLASTEDEWRRVVDVNFLGTVRCSHVVLPAMAERGRGAVVSIGSDAGRVGSSGEAVYSGTKGAIMSFTKTVARELARKGVRLNCICPGPTDTPLMATVTAENPGLGKALEKAIPMGRLADPSEIARAVAFLASDAAGFITGQTLSVSGGLTMA